jgi:glycosyltransferase involved in cell wall biosynthesis
MKSVLTASPLVSVVIPAYNAEAFIQKTLTSVLSQTYKNLEILVIDDGSTDRTVEIVEAMAEGDRRIRLLQQSNSGVAAARNLGIKHAKGEFIAPLDADDIWYPQNIEKQVQCFLESNANVGLVYSWSADVDDQDIPTGTFHTAQIEGKVYSTLLCHDFLGNASSSLIRRTCFQKVGLYNCQFREQNAQGCEDWDLYLRIAEQYQFRVVPEVLVGYRKIQSSMSCNYRSMANSHLLMLQASQQKHSEIPAVLYRLSTSSFFLYLARQSSQQGQHHNTLFWLQQTLQVDWFISFLRLDLCVLFLKTVLRLAPRRATLPIRLIYALGMQFRQTPHYSHSLLGARGSASSLKSALEIALHQLLSTTVLLLSRVETVKQSFQDFRRWRSL